LISFRGAFIDEKRRLEARIAQLEEELEEEQTNTELTGDKHKKLAMTVEQLMLDLAAEKANNQKAEVSFERKEMRCNLLIVFSRLYAVILKDKIENYEKNLRKMKNLVKANQEPCWVHSKLKSMHLKNNLMVKFGKKDFFCLMKMST
jgi:myosin protein heavy chain